MKRVAMMTVALALSMLVVGQALAQPGQRERQRPEGERPAGQRLQAAGPMAGVMMAVRGLELTDEERTAVRGVMGEYREQIQELAQNAAPNEDEQGQIRQARQEVMQQVRDGDLQREEVRETLTKRTNAILGQEKAAAAQALQAKVQEMVQAMGRVLSSENAEALKAALEAPRRWGAGAERPERPARPERLERGEARGRGDRPARPDRGPRTGRED